MAGTIAQGELTRRAGDLSIAIATPADDPEIRALLRDNPMDGEIRISLEREPNYFDSVSVGWDAHQTIVVRHRMTGRIVCVGSVADSMRYINGSPQRVGYLGGLRLASVEKSNFAALRSGFRFFHNLHDCGGPSVYLTSIVSDNHRARRFLEAGLPGMPTYRPIGEFITLVIPVLRRGEFFRAGPAARAELARRGYNLRRARPDDAAAIADFLAATAARFQFAPQWTSQNLFGDLSTPFPNPTDFRLVLNRGQVIGCAALWDQRPFKQIVVHGYSDRLARWRPILNFAGSVIPGMRLPSIGQPIHQAFISHFAIDEQYPEIALPLLLSIHGPAYQRRLDYLILGLSVRDPRLPLIRKKYRCRTYSSQLYLVYFPDAADQAAEIDDRIPFPEVATL